MKVPPPHLSADVLNGSPPESVLVLFGAELELQQDNEIGQDDAAYGDEICSVHVKNAAWPGLLFTDVVRFHGDSARSRTRKFDRHASSGVNICYSHLEFGYKIRCLTQKSVTSYFVYPNSRRE